MKPLRIYSILSFLILLNIIFNINANNINKGGYNIYKDFLRGRNEENQDIEDLVSDDGKSLSKLVYFYRTPVSPGLNTLTDEISKRTVNKFKNMMLNKESIEAALDEEPRDVNRFYIPRTMTKRYPGAILSWAIPAANRVRIINTNYRPPGFNRPAA